MKLELEKVEEPFVLLLVKMRNREKKDHLNCKWNYCTVGKMTMKSAHSFHEHEPLSHEL